MSLFLFSDLQLHMEIITYHLRFIDKLLVFLYFRYTNCTKRILNAAVVCVYQIALNVTNNFEYRLN